MDQQGVWRDTRTTFPRIPRGRGGTALPRDAVARTSGKPSRRYRSGLASTMPSIISMTTSARGEDRCGGDASVPRKRGGNSHLSNPRGGTTALRLSRRTLRIVDELLGWWIHVLAHLDENGARKPNKRDVWPDSFPSFQIRYFGKLSEAGEEGGVETTEERRL